MSFDHFRQIISELTQFPLEQIGEHTSFRDDIGIDSLRMVHLLVSVTQKLNVTLDSFRNVDDIQTVGGMFSSMTNRGATL